MLIILIVVYLYESLPDEIHLLDIALETDDSFTWSVNSAVHTDDKLIGEASLALFKEVIEASFKFLEHSSVLDEIGLHLWSDLLVELELFDDQVEIIKESLFDILSNIVVKSWLNMERLVGLLNFLDPHVQRVKFLFDEIIEVVRSVEDTIDGTHEEREESQTHELESNGEDVLIRSRS